MIDESLYTLYEKHEVERSMKILIFMTIIYNTHI